MRPDQHARLGDDQRPELAVVVLKSKLPALVFVPEDGMDAGDRYILRDADIHILLPPNVNLALVLEGDELEDFPLILVLLLHYLQHDVGLFGFWDVDCVKLLVVEVDAVLVVRLAHLADERFPVYGDTEVVYDRFDLLGQPLLEAEQVDVAHRTDAFARSYQGIAQEAGLEADTAHVLLSGLL